MTGLAVQIAHRGTNVLRHIGPRVSRLKLYGRHSGRWQVVNDVLLVVERLADATPDVGLSIRSNPGLLTSFSPLNIVGRAPTASLPARARTKTSQPGLIISECQPGKHHRHAPEGCRESTPCQHGIRLCHAARGEPEVAMTTHPVPVIRVNGAKETRNLRCYVRGGNTCINQALHGQPRLEHVRCGDRTPEQLVGTRQSPVLTAHVGRYSHSSTPLARV